MMRRITKEGLVKALGKMLGDLQIGVEDMWIETIHKEGKRIDYLKVQYANGTMADADVTRKNAWRTAAIALLLAGKEKVV